MTDENAVVTGLLLDETVRLTLLDLCRAGKIHADYVIELVEEGVLEPQGDAPHEWRFDTNALKRLHRALRLQQDLGVNLPGVALALDLLEEIECLRRHLRTRAIGEIDDGWG